MLLIFIQNATTYSTLIKNLCNGTNTSGVCANAISGISPTCLASLNSSNKSVCTGTCGTQLTAVVTACDNVSVVLLSVYISSIFTYQPYCSYVLLVHKHLRTLVYTPICATCNGLAGIWQWKSALVK